MSATNTFRQTTQICVLISLTAAVAFAQSGDISGSTSNFMTLGTTILKVVVALAGIGFVGLLIWGGLTLTTNPRGLAMIGGGLVGPLLAGFAFALVNTLTGQSVARGLLLWPECRGLSSMISDERNLEPINHTLNWSAHQFLCIS